MRLKFVRVPSCPIFPSICADIPAFVNCSTICWLCNGCCKHNGFCPNAHSFQCSIMSPIKTLLSIASPSSPSS